MNLINDLGTEIAFAFLVEKRHNEKIESKDVLPLIDRLSEVLEQVSAREELAEQILLENKIVQSAAH